LQQGAEIAAEGQARGLVAIEHVSAVVALEAEGSLQRRRQLASGLVVVGAAVQGVIAPATTITLRLASSPTASAVEGSGGPITGGPPPVVWASFIAAATASGVASAVA
jgi:hypothetical protein